MTVPNSLVVMVPSPSLSNREKASLNSGGKETKKIQKVVEKDEGKNISKRGDVTKVTLHRLLRSMCDDCFLFLISYLQSALLLAGQPKKNKKVRLKRLLKHLKKLRY